ncbi:MAG TPA: 50S ribosomal protein L22 [Candidatus Omnitrophota bacterium]|nr:50S ribosomal protein L22 [Candidatus Omnitrophota bacterium]HPB67481.1 50S ribosomal protein L22 [Candidatus Omnitrophota bacterium]HQO57472.1 50S ribosomal protein L22 [Candidatus Omnitrophota bacterium]HQP11498.1 50S ribosomal protein L22 [Candidatus Omnitrophota bacterium]
MIAKARCRYVRVPSSKANQVMALIRGKDVLTSLALLKHTDKRVTEAIAKILNSAVSNAKQKGLTESQLYISKITADQGPMWKRYRAATFGRATPILKRTSHLTIELDLITK